MSADASSSAGEIVSTASSSVPVTGSYRRVLMTTCQAHGAAGFTNLLVTKENGVIVLNPHVASCCVLRLDEQAVRTLHSIFGEWLG
jgi:hypothetical protein